MKKDTEKQCALGLLGYYKIMRKFIQWINRLSSRTKWLGIVGSVASILSLFITLPLIPLNSRETARSGTSDPKTEQTNNPPQFDVKPTSNGNSFTFNTLGGGVTNLGNGKIEQNITNNYINSSANIEKPSERVIQPQGIVQSPSSQQQKYEQLSQNSYNGEDYESSLPLRINDHGRGGHREGGKAGDIYQSLVLAQIVRSARVVVRDSKTRRPIVQAKITFLSKDFSPTGYTDSEGIYILPSIPLRANGQEGRLIINKEGYEVYDRHVRIGEILEEVFLTPTFESSSTEAQPQGSKIDKRRSLPVDIVDITNSELTVDGFLDINGAKEKSADFSISKTCQIEILWPKETGFTVAYVLLSDRGTKITSSLLGTQPANRRLDLPAGKYTFTLKAKRDAGYYSARLRTYCE